MIEENLDDFESTSISESDSGSDTSSVIQSNRLINNKNNYIKTCKSIIFENEEINTENALKLNAQFKAHLKILKIKLEQILHKVRTKYRENEQLLEKFKKNPQRVGYKTKRQNSFFFCGAPFFKGSDCISAQPNQDYIYRKNVLKEFFPLELSRLVPIWVSADKAYLIRGVKDQLLQRIVSIQKDLIRKNDQNCSGIIDDIKILQKKQLSDLFSMLNNQPFIIDWYTISTKDLDGRHPSHACKAIWDGFLNPMLNRKPWTPEENRKLLEVVNAFNQQDWPAISKQINERSGYQCLIQYRTSLSDINKVKNVKWTPIEDSLLLETIERLQIGNVIPWNSVVEKIPNRTKSQVYNRYHWTLKPGIKKDKFSIEEDCIIIAAVKEHGTNFHKFPSYLLPGRTIVQIRNRYNNVLKFVGKNTPWSSEDDEKLMCLIGKYGVTNWKSIAEEMITHNRLSCRSRYCTIMRFLKKNPKKTFRDVPRKKKPISTNVTEDNWMETIINVKQLGTSTGSSSNCNSAFNKQITRATKKQVDKEYLDYFKYSFNFQFKSICSPDANINECNKAVYQILFNNICPNDYRILTGTYNEIEIDMEYKSFVGRNEYDFLLPPSYSTTLLLRGLSQMIPVAKPKNQKSLQQMSSDNKNDLELFKKRFFTLLYCTALVSKLKFPTQTYNANEETSVVIADGTFNANIENESDYDLASPSSECNNEIDNIDDKSEKPIISDEKLTYTLRTNEGEYEISIMSENPSTDNENQRKRKEANDIEEQTVPDFKKIRYDYEKKDK